MPNASKVVGHAWKATPSHAVAGMAVMAAQTWLGPSASSAIGSEMQWRHCSSAATMASRFSALRSFNSST
jgi:hypothetical protein